VIARRLVFLVASLFFLGGCKPRAPEAPRIPVDLSEIESSLRQLDRESQAIRRYQGFVRIRGKGPDGSFHGRLVVIFERPNDLRIELLGPFGSTRWSAVASENGIRVLFPGSKEYVEELDTADIVGRLLGIPLNAEEVMALLSGVGIPPDVEVISAYRQGPVTIGMLAEGGRLELAEDGQVSNVQTRTYRVSYSTSWKKRRRQIPDRLLLSTESMRITLSAEDVDINVPLDPKAFELEIPDGAARLKPADVAGEAVFVVTKISKSK
jgi:outer membrane biogenesis lipoprotein LolB